MPEKAIYSLTEAGEAEFERLMFEISGKPINIFLDFNAVIVNLDSLPPEKQKSCIAEIEENISTLKSYLEHNIQKKENEPSIPATGMAVLRQQYVLVEAIQAWIASLKRELTINHYAERPATLSGAGLLYMNYKLQLTCI